MNDDRWLQELAQIRREKQAAEEDRLDERWDRLADGTLTADEEAELRALAATSEEAHEAYEAFRPLGPELQARVLAAARSELAGNAARADPSEPRARLLPFRRAVSRAEVWLGTAAAIAAALFLFLRTPAALPLYIAETPGGGIEVLRGGEGSGGRRMFVPGSTVTLLVRPQHRVDGKIEAVSFLAHGGQLVPWQPRIETEGSVRLQGELGREVQPGEWKLWVVVGRPGKIPATEELQAALRSGQTRGAGWQAVSADLRVEVQPPP